MVQVSPSQGMRHPRRVGLVAATVAVSRQWRGTDISGTKILYSLAFAAILWASLVSGEHYLAIRTLVLSSFDHVNAVVSSLESSATGATPPTRDLSYNL